MVLKLEITDGEDGPSALLRVDLSVGDSQITFGTGTDCRVVFPAGKGVRVTHCHLTLQNAGSLADLANSMWELKPSDGEVRVPALANTEDGGFRQVLEKVRDHTAPALQPLEFVLGTFHCMVEFENDNFGVAEFANSNSLGLRVNAGSGAAHGSALSHEAESPEARRPPPAEAAASPANPSLPTMRKTAWEEGD
jgi:hypothetical protein